MMNKATGKKCDDTTRTWEPSGPERCVWGEVDPLGVRGRLSMGLARGLFLAAIRHG